MAGPLLYRVGRRAEKKIGKIRAGEETVTFKFELFIGCLSKLHIKISRPLISIFFLKSSFISATFDSGIQLA